MTTRGLLVVLSAPSGGGKTTICDALLRRDQRITRSISATTRPPRAGEKNGRDYYFVNEDEFRRMIRSREFLEWARVHSHRYGTPKKAVLRQQLAGKDVMLVIDVQGGLAVKRRYPQAVLIFVKPPSLQALQTRLRGRGTDSPQTIRERLRNARWELSFAPQYEYQVVNEDLEQAVDQVQAIITAERLRTVKSGRRTPPAPSLAKRGRAKNVTRA